MRSVNAFILSFPIFLIPALSQTGFWVQSCFDNQCRKCEAKFLALESQTGICLEAGGVRAVRITTRSSESITSDKIPTFRSEIANCTKAGGACGLRFPHECQLVHMRRSFDEVCLDLKVPEDQLPEQVYVAHSPYPYCFQYDKKQAANGIPKHLLHERGIDDWDMLGDSEDLLDNEDPL